MANAKTDSRIVIFVSLCLVALIIGVYFQTILFDFVGFDDELYVTENPHVQKGISTEGLKSAFTTFYSANWHPLTWLSHMLDYELYGLNAGGHHWTNVEFHIANTLLLFFILFKMTGAVWRSAFVAALFALHPLHVESVAWVSERKDVLSTFFGLLSIVAYYCYVKKSSAKYYLLVFVLLSISLMAKPMLVTLPFILLLLDFWPLKRFQYHRDIHLNPEKAYGDSFRRNYLIILEKVPLFIPVVISCVLTFFAQKSWGAIQVLERLSLKTRIANALVSYVNYGLKMFWPSKLAVFYPHPGNTLPVWQIVGATLLMVAACYWAIKTAKKYPYIPVGLFWYLGTLVPVIGLIQVGEQAMADRYTYIPLIGLFIITSWGVPDLINEGNRGRKSDVSSQRLAISLGFSNLFKERRFKKIFLGISSGILMVALSWATFLQLKYWKNGVTLFEHAIKVTKNNAKANNNLATALGSKDIDRSIYHYKEALRINPVDDFALYNLGTILIQNKDYNGAVFNLTKLLKLNPRHIDARNNLANVLFLQSKADEAISQYRKILQIDTENVAAHYNLAYILSTQGKLTEATRLYKKTLSIDPDYSKAHYNLGNIYLNQGKTAEAYMHYAEAVKIKPDYFQAYNKLGLILLRQGKFNKAKVFFSKAIEIDPNYIEASKHLNTINKTLSTSR